MLGERRFVDGKRVREGKGEVLIAGAAREQMGGKTGSLLQTPGCDLFGARGRSSTGARALQMLRHHFACSLVIPSSSFHRPNFNNTITENIEM